MYWPTISHNLHAYRAKNQCWYLQQPKPTFVALSNAGPIRPTTLLSTTKSIFPTIIPPLFYNPLWLLQLKALLFSKIDYVPFIRPKEAIFHTYFDGKHTKTGFGQI